MEYTNSAFADSSLVNYDKITTFTNLPMNVNKGFKN